MKKYLKYGLVFLPLIGGIIVSLLLDFDIYQEINLPSFAPPSILFPIAWSILYLFMGIVLYRIRHQKYPLIVFGIQLFLNYLWCFVFFIFQSFLLSYIVIILLDIVVIYLLFSLYKKDMVSFYLLIPYLLWIIFASVLNWSIYLLN